MVSWNTLASFEFRTFLGTMGATVGQVSRSQLEWLYIVPNSFYRVCGNEHGSNQTKMNR